MVQNPAASAAMSIPPMPVNKLMCVNFSIQFSLSSKKGKTLVLPLQELQGIALQFFLMPAMITAVSYTVKKASPIVKNGLPFPASRHAATGGTNIQ